MASFVEKIRRAKAELAARAADPLLAKVQGVLHGMEAISTNALLDLIGLPQTTSNGRRLAKTMRALGFIPVKSRRLMPGGYEGTVTRGWSLPVRSPKNSASVLNPTAAMPAASQLGA
jgi:hypothetical protein